jgi:hypothetical protein
MPRVLLASVQATDEERNRIYRDRVIHYIYACYFDEEKRGTLTRACVRVCVYVRVCKCVCVCVHLFSLSFSLRV